MTSNRRLVLSDRWGLCQSACVQRCCQRTWSQTVFFFTYCSSVEWQVETDCTESDCIIYTVEHCIKSIVSFFWGNNAVLNLDYDVIQAEAFLRIERFFFNTMKSKWGIHALQKTQEHHRSIRVVQCYLCTIFQFSRSHVKALFVRKRP